MRQWNRRRFITNAGLAAGAGLASWRVSAPASLIAQLQAPIPGVPDEILNPVEVSGADAEPIMGRLPGAKRMYVLPNDAGEFHRIGSQVMRRVARREDTGDAYELATFAGSTGATMPRHAHLSSHAAVLIMRGEVEMELGAQRWRMRRGDFANVPPGTPHGWTMRADNTQLALFSMNDRVGAAFTAMGQPQADSTIPTGVAHEIAPGSLARASLAGDFQLAPGGNANSVASAVTNKQVPLTPGPYVIADGGGDRFGGNTFLARNANTGGQFLVIITEGGRAGGVPAHFHARHFENFLALDGETIGWAHGKAVSLRTGDYFQAPPRHLHGFRLNDQYNRFAAFLSPGIFESFFTGGRAVVTPADSAPPGATPPASVVGAPPQGRPGGPPQGRALGPPDGPAGGGRGGAPAFGPEMFLQLQRSGRGPDGYPLDVHPAKLPLPPQDPIWTQGVAGTPIADRAALLAHAQAICGLPVSREITPELRRALALKPRQEDFL